MSKTSRATAAISLGRLFKSSYFAGSISFWMMTCLPTFAIFGAFSAIAVACFSTTTISANALRTSSTLVTAPIMEIGTHGDGTRPSLPFFQFTEPGTRRIRLLLRTTGSTPSAVWSLPTNVSASSGLDCLIQPDQELPAGAASPYSERCDP